MKLLPLLFATALISTPASALPVQERASPAIFSTGDGLGLSIGVQAYSQITWYNRYSFHWKLEVTDRRADANSVYAWLKVYAPGGVSNDLIGFASNTLTDNHRGHDKSVTQEKTYTSYQDGSGNREAITGVRIKACVNDAGSDTCTKNTSSDFVANPYA